MVWSVGGGACNGVFLGLSSSLVVKVFLWWRSFVEGEGCWWEH